MPLQLLANDRQAFKSHVEHQGLLRANQRRPVEIETAILEMARDELHRVGMIAMSQRDSRVSGAARGGGDARHDLKVDACFRQGGQFFSTAAKNERIAALETQDPAPFPRIVDQHVIDRVLIHGMHFRTLADMDQLRVRAYAREYFLAYQAVVQHDIRAVQQPQRAQGEQVRIAGSRSDQPDFPGLLPAAGQNPLKHRLRLFFPSGIDEFGHFAVENVLPESRTAGEIRDPVFHFLAHGAQQVGKTIDARRHHHFVHFLQAAGQYGRRA